MGPSSVDPNTGTNYQIPIAFESGSSLTIKPQDTLSLFSFLEYVGTVKNSHKQTTFDSQSVDAVINKEYFLGVAQQISYLTQKYIETSSYADAYDALITSYNARVATLNTAIDNYNNLKNTFNSKINDMNNAINTINGLSSVGSSDITAYNQAVAIYNSYLTLTGNPGLLSYASTAQTVYNIPTAFDNNHTIPQLNHQIDKLDIGIPPIPLFSPATAPVGSSTYSLQAFYSTTPIPTIPQITTGDLAHISTLPDPISKADIINTYFLPFAQKYLEALAATSKKLASIDDYRAFVNLIQKQGFLFNPAQVDAFIMNSSKPSVPGGEGSTGTSLGSMMVGLDTQNLERILSTALFKAISADAKVPIPPHIYDQVNALALSLLSQIGAAAGLSVVKLFGETLKSLTQDAASVQLAIAAAILQSILKVVGDGKATAEALLNLLKGIPGITEDLAKQLANQLATAQNVSLLLFGALSTATYLKSPSLVQDILNTNFNPPPPSLNTTTETNTIPSSSPSVYNLSDNQNPFSQQNVNDVLNNNQSSYAIQNTLSDRLSEDAKIPKPQASSIINQALTNTAKALPQNGTEDQFKKSLADELLKQNLRQEEVQYIVENAALFLNPPKLSPEQLNAKIESSIQNLLKNDVASSLPKSVSDNLIKLLTDTKNPNSFASLIVSQLRDLKIQNQEKIVQEITAQRREFERPNIDTFVTFKRIMDPANSIVLSFMTGLMYDKVIPTNWQRPLSIQV